ncbi:GDP-fucose protein O-fucosyltransferase 2-like [Clavelina lepadiformis]|uniref:GDP-fucose protein O-fucosyltransferase 2 n=1 Tax=Clavelina lepadiformis TaxID=159417 RepID=A0ABP0GJ43_CLALP
MKYSIHIFSLILCLFQSGSLEAPPNRRYLLYDCNPGEGFNLRRDVYLRIANLLQSIRSDKKCKNDDWVLVLPPWGRIGYHWKERGMEQSRIKWSTFFDVESLNKYIPVMEYEDYIEEVGEPMIEEVWYLQGYAEGWTSGEWVEKIHERPCIDTLAYESGRDGKFRGWFWGYEETYAKKFKCVSVQGMAKILVGPLCGGNTTAKSVMLDRGESVLHDMFGGINYWKCRRSMVFSEALRKEADKFRMENLDSNDEKDKTVMPRDWRDHKCTEDALGGPYIALHYRRKDFLHVRKEGVPSILRVAEQLNQLMKKYKVKKVFVASDGTKEEMEELKSLVPGMVMYTPTKEKLKALKMGGVAIIDQIICSHAKYFIGSKESTFSFRIQEEREIMCFQKDTTFNRFCGDAETSDCEQPTRWKIVWKSDSEIWD